MLEIILTIVFMLIYLLYINSTLEIGEKSQNNAKILFNREFIFGFFLINNPLFYILCQDDYYYIGLIIGIIIGLLFATIQFSMFKKYIKYIMKYLDWFIIVAIILFAVRYFPWRNNFTGENELLNAQPIKLIFNYLYINFISIAVTYICLKLFPLHSDSLTITNYYVILHGCVILFTAMVVQFSSFLMYFLLTAIGGIYYVSTYIFIFYKINKLYKK